MATFNDTVTRLASGFRQRFQVSGLLTFEDMIKLVTPPPYPLLLDTGGTWYFTDGAWSMNRTKDNGTCIEGAAYVIQRLYTKNESLLDDPDNRPDLVLRLHLFITDTQASQLTWGIYGSGILSTISPKKGESVSDFNLPTKLKVTGLGNPLEFHSSGGSTIVDTSKSYIEIIVGG
ncbi:hypothetical protein [Limosilactobacillus oris]|uniref:hypothetical protein n=1 Tax=Limosilactobacillus oris TaxID=1632 RepID=UPI0024B38DF2|nr:hypothetical protein [Limosilactobacillus oris]WHO84879.1 hypothetical protein QLX69_05775 [Limosilactobacillus oris]